MKTLAELADAARRLEAAIPTPAAIVLAEARSAGYSTRIDPQDGGVHRIYEQADPMDRNRVDGGRTLVGMLVVRGDVITYAEWHPGVGTSIVFPLWPNDDVGAHEQQLRELVDRIRDDRIER